MWPPILDIILDAHLPSQSIAKFLGISWPIALRAMPSKCFGALCNQLAASGGARGRAEKRYDKKCPACHHHAKGTALQVHRSGGVDGYCLNYPSCKHWNKYKCKGYCVQCFKAMGGTPPTRKRPAAVLSRRPPAPAHQLKLASFRLQAAPMLETSASVAGIKSFSDHQGNPKETSSNSYLTAPLLAIPFAREPASTVTEPFKKRLRTKSSPPEGTPAANRCSEVKLSSPGCEPVPTQKLSAARIGDHAHRQCDSCDKRAYVWTSKFQAFCHSCAHCCSRCDKRATFRNKSGKLLCMACAARTRLKVKEFNNEPKHIQQHVPPCGIVGCEALVREHLIRWTPELHDRGCFPQGSKFAVFCATRSLLLHRCIASDSAMIKSPTTNSGTSCQLLQSPQSQLFRAHSCFHHPPWTSIENFLGYYWDKGFCKAHAAWLLKYLDVLKYVAANGSLPLQGQSSGLSRWLRRQLCNVRALRRRIQKKQQISERSVTPEQHRLLRQLPGWQSTGRWQNPSNKMRQAQSSRRLLQCERDSFASQDFKTAINESHATADAELRSICQEFRLVLESYPGRPSSTLKFVA